MRIGKERSKQEAEARAGNGAPSNDGPTRPLGSQGAG
jgi:hypothetical protein